jgi:hypothetical protein
MCWLLIGGLTLGLEQQGALFQKVCLHSEKKKGENEQRGSIAGNLSAEGDKGKVGMGSYLCMGPFILALDTFYGLTGNFIICFEPISSSKVQF